MVACLVYFYLESHFGNFAIKTVSDKILTIPDISNIHSTYNLSTNQPKLQPLHLTEFYTLAEALSYNTLRYRVEKSDLFLIVTLFCYKSIIMSRTAK